MKKEAIVVAILAMAISGAIPLTNIVHASCSPAPCREGDALWTASNLSTPTTQQIGGTPTFTFSNTKVAVLVHVVTTGLLSNQPTMSDTLGLTYTAKDTNVGTNGCVSSQAMCDQFYFATYTCKHNCSAVSDTLSITFASVGTIGNVMVYTVAISGITTLTNWTETLHSSGGKTTTALTGSFKAVAFWSAYYNASGTGNPNTGPFNTVAFQNTTPIISSGFNNVGTIGQIRGDREITTTNAQSDFNPLFENGPVITYGVALPYTAIIIGLS